MFLISTHAIFSAGSLCLLPAMSLSGMFMYRKNILNDQCD